MGDWYQHGIRIEAIPVDDRAFQYGDGVFETVAVRDASPRFWDLHMQRLASACARLRVPARASRTSRSSRRSPRATD